ncbi:Hypothetical protein LUCI_1962 [Lucifera butyrica]|uniref:Thioredoxin-like fold n=1 Tax=Lucifera butyrica TaxID=1351585 RepID=A0A498R276_9FIRM|nr:NAD(P)H-dependent oxidoreductase subunit E [Lucifera butyrica]VBB06726.1 Hypothetical protein LUCI_1962 [Lucifera butyrica]
MKPLTLEICEGTSCHLLGSQDLLEAVAALPPDQRERIELREVSCLKSCHQGPSVRINGTVLPDMTPGRLVAVIHDYLSER